MIMTIVTSYDVESDTWTHHTGDTDARAAWRQAVAEIAAKAKETLPECNGRVDSAVKIVLAGDVELLEGGTAKVASQSNGTTVYHIVNGECTCKDFPKAPSGWCKHRIAAGLAKRVAARVRAPLDAPATGQAAPASEPTAVQASPAVPSTPLPEAPVSITLKATLNGHEVLVTLRGTDFASVKVQVEAASQWLQAQGGQPTADTPQCPTHGVAMKLNHGKDGSTWYSHKTADGWCKGR
jgi:hypothetical protein